MKGIAFVQILDETIDPVAAIQYIFHKAVETNSSLSRFAARVIPIQRTCYAHEEEVIAMLKEMIPAVFNDSTKGQSVDIRGSSFTKIVVHADQASEQ